MSKQFFFLHKMYFEGIELLYIQLFTLQLYGVFHPSKLKFSHNQNIIYSTVNTVLHLFMPPTK